MNYELAKKLKENGWPQHGKEMMSPRDENLYQPTLSELIEACGDKFVALIKHDDKSGWTAMKYGDTLLPKKHSEGSTPEEAVANLWLALQGK